MITLNGERLPGFNMTIRANFRLEDKDLSGQSSASDTAEAGIKPQVLSVSMQIRMKDAGDLSRLIAMARAQDDTGKRTVYDIVNPTAAAGNIRQVKFSENFSYVENDTTRAWQVNFTLREFQSVPEKIEQRQEQPTATEQTAEGETITSTEPEEETVQYTGFKKILKNLDDKLGG